MSYTPLQKLMLELARHTATPAELLIRISEEITPLIAEQTGQRVAGHLRSLAQRLLEDGYALGPEGLRAAVVATENAADLVVDLTTPAPSPTSRESAP